jgi:hypothetical protein
MLASLYMDVEKRHKFPYAYLLARNKRWNEEDAGN